MKFVRGFFLVLSVILLFFSILLGNIFWVISSSLEYNVVSSELASFINQGYNLSDSIDKNYDSMENHCSLHESYFYANSFGSFILPCSDVSLGFNSTLNLIIEKNSSLSEKNTLENITQDISKIYPLIKDYCSPNKSYYVNALKTNISCDQILLGKDKFKESIIKSSIDKIYYAEYTCNFWDCFQKTGLPFFLVSKKAVDYWNSKIYVSLLVSFFLLVIIFFLLRNKYNFVLLLGILLFLSSIPLFNFESFTLFLINFSLSIFGQSAILNGFSYINSIDSNIILSIVSVFFSRANFVFWFVFILGILLIVSGVILKFWSFFSGRTKQIFSRREVENIVKNEIKKSKK